MPAAAGADGRAAQEGLTLRVHHGNSRGRSCGPEAAGRRLVAKPEWGTKRICPSCSARFYDMQRDPIVCPACGVTMDLTVQTKPKRSRAAAVKAAVVAPEEVEVEEPVVDDAADNDDDDATADDASESDEEESNSAIEDVSELGDDDMTDVIDTEIEDDEADR